MSPINRKLLGTFTSQAELDRYRPQGLPERCVPCLSGTFTAKDSLKAVQYLSIAMLNYKPGEHFYYKNTSGVEGRRDIISSIKKRLEPFDPSLFIYTSYYFYSVLIASNAESFMALLAGIYPAITPTSDENTKAVIISHKGMIDIFGLSVAPVP